MKKMTKEEEQRRIREWTQGKELEELFQYYGGLVAHTVRKTFSLCHARFKKEDIEDLTQDVFVRLFEQECNLLKQYNEERGLHFTGWIKLITTQTVMMYLRKKDRLGRLGKDPLSPIEKEIGQETDLHHKTEAKMTLARIEKRLKKLPTLERLVFKLHFFDGLSLQEVASSLNREINYIYQIKHRAVTLLKDMLDEEK